MAMPDRRRRPRAIAVGVVLALHVALIGWLQQADHRPAAHQEQRRSSVRMVPLRLPPLTSPNAEPPASPRRPVAVRRARPDPDASTRGQSTLHPIPSEAPAARALDRADEDARGTVVTAPPIAAASAASGPTGRDLLYGAATQRAIRQSTQGQPLLAERADRASQAPDKVDASTQLGNEMMKGATGDCLKGEYAGGGMGLLSAPFWLLAEARGKCRR